MNVLFVGRFQPLHLGHCSVIKDLQEQGHIVVIGLGSSQYHSTDTNPLSNVDRIWCFQQVFPGIQVIELPDIHDNAKWVAHVQQILYTAATSIDLVVSGNSNTLELFEAAHVPTQTVSATIQVSATQIRSWIREHNPIWKNYVPTVIQNYIESRIA